MSAVGADALLAPGTLAVDPISPVESVESLDTPSPPPAGNISPSPAGNSSASDPPLRSSSHHSARSSSSASKPAPATSSTPTCSPGRRRPKPPAKGILKPPPPPARPTLGGRLRDLAANVVSQTNRTLFDADDPGPSSRPAMDLTGPTSPGSVSAAVGGTLNALSGRIGMGLSKFVGTVAGSPGPSPGSTPTGSPMPSKIALPDAGPVVSEKVRQKQPLRRATFVLPSLSITYPISSHGEPWSTKVIEDRQRIESSHRNLLSATTGADYWTAYKLVRLYETACKGREERPRVGIVRALETLPSKGRPRSIHLTLKPFDPSTPLSATPPPHGLEVPLNRHAAEALADVLSSEWGLSELKLENGAIEDELALKPILHALLVSGTLPSLSLAGNRKMREKGWRLLAVFLKKATSLKFVDLSDTNWDKRSIDYLVQALSATPIRTTTTVSSPAPGPVPLPEEKDSPAPADSEQFVEDEDENAKPSGRTDCYGSFMPPAPLLKEAEETAAAVFQTLKMDGCLLRGNVLESLASGIRTSEIRNISLRRNKIGPLGAVALAVMIRDYPDTTLSIANLSGVSPAAHTSAAAPLISVDGFSGGGYASYIPRTRRPNGTSPQVHPTSDDNLPPIPLVQSPSAGVTSRTLPEGYKPPPPPKNQYTLPPGGTAMQDSALSVGDGKAVGIDSGASMALQRHVKSLEGIERIGRLTALDLKSNDIRNGVGYIAQVLKRNRTLKVLNLSDNKIEPSGLVALAEALKYNSTLDSLDLSSNPCCGPSLEGVASLRTTFTVNTALKRLFLSDTGLTPEGAISLAEFLPETKSLLHLDLTSNRLDVAGILALASGLKSNHLIRCLDVSIPPNNPDLAEQSQSILQSCIRNTELAAEAATGKPSEGIWQPIKRSVLVRQVKEAEEFRAQRDLVDLASSVEGKAREYVYKLTPDRLIPVCEVTGRDIEKWLEAGTAAQSPHFQAWSPGQLPAEDFKPLVERGKALRERIVDEVQREMADERLARLLELNDSLQAVLERCRGFVPPSRLLLPSQIVLSGMGEKEREKEARTSFTEKSGGDPEKNGIGRGVPAAVKHRRHMRGSSLEISSPNFSIGDSDGDSDAEEVDVGSFSGSASQGRAQLSPRGPAHSGSRPIGLGLAASSPPPSPPRSSSKGVSSKSSPLASTSVSATRPSPLMHLHQDLSALRLDPSEAGADDTLEAALREAVSSPVERVGKAWIEEEGEIFRKGVKLGVADDTEGEGEGEGFGDVSGEELRHEILETEVARSPTRRVLSVDETDPVPALEQPDTSVARAAER